MTPCIDSPPPASGTGDHGRGCAWRRGTFVGSLHTRRTQWDVDQTGERLGVVGALASGCVRGAGDGGQVTGIVRAPEMAQEADKDKSSQ
jgi:hypothetical protein